MQCISPLGLHCACVYVLMFVWDGGKEEREGVRVKWSYQGCAGPAQPFWVHVKKWRKKTKKKTSYCAGLLLRAANTHRHARAHTRTQPPCMTTLHAGTTGWLKTDTDDFFCDLSALLPQTKKEKGSYVHKQQKKKTVFWIRSPNIISQREKGEHSQGTLRITHSQK